MLTQENIHEAFVAAHRAVTKTDPPFLKWEDLPEDIQKKCHLMAYFLSAKDQMETTTMLTPVISKP